MQIMFFNQKMDYGTKIENIDEVLSKHYEKKGGFATSLVTQFLSCKGHLQLIVFVCHEC